MDTADGGKSLNFKSGDLDCSTCCTTGTGGSGP